MSRQPGVPNARAFWASWGIAASLSAWLRALEIDRSWAWRACSQAPPDGSLWKQLLFKFENCFSEKKIVDYMAQYHACDCVFVAFRVSWPRRVGGKGHAIFENAWMAFEKRNSSAVAQQPPLVSVLESMEPSMRVNSPIHYAPQPQCAPSATHFLPKQTRKSRLWDSHAFFERSTFARLLVRCPFMTHRFPVTPGSIESDPIDFGEAQRLMRRQVT